MFYCVGVVVVVVGVGVVGVGVGISITCFIIRMHNISHITITFNPLCLNRPAFIPHILLLILPYNTIVSFDAIAIIATTPVQQIPNRLLVLLINLTIVLPHTLILLDNITNTSHNNDVAFYHSDTR
jgi:hypothetical protein